MEVIELDEECAATVDPKGSVTIDLTTAEPPVLQDAATQTIGDFQLPPKRFQVARALHVQDILGAMHVARARPWGAARRAGHPTSPPSPPAARGAPHSAPSARKASHRIFNGLIRAGSGQPSLLW